MGSYTVRLTLIGYRAVVYENVRVQLGETTTLGEIRLEATAVQLPGIVVEARSVVIDPTTAAIATNLSAGAIDDLPTDRDYLEIVELLPHANTSYYGDAANIGGATGLENIYYIDGVNVTDPYRGVTGTNLPYNFVQEIQVKQGGYEAEYGKALGGIVNVITHSGGNDFQGSAFGFFTSSALAADARPALLDADVQQFSSWDVGFTLGGPVLRDKLWFFAAYNPSFVNQDIALEGHGVFQDRLTSHRFAGKLTWRATRNTDVLLSVFGDPTTRDLVGVNEFASLFAAPVGLANPDPFLGYRKSGGVNFTLKGQTVLGRRGLLQASLARYQRDEVDRGATEIGLSEPLFQDLETGIWSGGTGSAKDARTLRWTARLLGTVMLGAHTVKAGVEYEDNFLDLSWLSTEPGVIFAVPSLGLYQTLIFDPVYEARNRVPTVYAQDSWRITDRLLVNLGVRWDGQYLIAAGDTVAQPISDQWQPRLGFTYQPGELGTQKIFGSYGRFYLQVPLNMPGDAFSVWRNAECVYSADPRDPTVEPDACLEVRPTDRPAATTVPGLEGEHLDEVTLGYERALGSHFKLGVRGIYRTLRAAFAGAFEPAALQDVLGNIGEGDLSFLPDPERDYTALELTFERVGARDLNFQLSYVLSRAHGNYVGQFDQGFAWPGFPFGLGVVEQGVNSRGLLPNDRTHVLKLFGSYRFDFGFTMGTFFSLQSGTPLNEFGASTIVFRPLYLVPRSSVQRTPTVWDLNLRLAYDLTRVPPLRGRIILDLLHIGNPRTTVYKDQTRFSATLPFDLAGLPQDAQGRWQELEAIQTAPNPNFGGALVNQAPMTVRLGLEVGF